MSKFYNVLFVSTAAISLSAGIQAQEVERPNYNFLALDYVYGVADPESSVLIEEASDNSWYFGEGAEAEASFALKDMWLFRASYYAGQGEFRDDVDVDISSAVVGVGYLLPTDDAVGIDVGLEYRMDTLEFDDQGFDEDIDGLGFVFGIRSTFLENHELGFRLGFYTGDFEEAPGFNLTYAWNFAEHWGLTASWERIDASPDTQELTDYEFNKYMIGARFYF